MTIQHTENLLKFWNDKFSNDDFCTLVSCVDKIVGNQKFGKNSFLMILSHDQRKLSQLMMTIKSIVGLVHCQQLSKSIDIGNCRTKLFIATSIDETTFQTISKICSFEYSQLTHTNANVICGSLAELKSSDFMCDKALIISML